MPAILTGIRKATVVPYANRGKEVISISTRDVLRTCMCYVYGSVLNWPQPAKFRLVLAGRREGLIWLHKQLVPALGGGHNRHGTLRQWR